jgi:outer membrane receptor protein involved in Fe transport
LTSGRNWYGFDWSASVRNLFDKSFSYVQDTGVLSPTLADPGRTFWLQAKYKF